MFGASGSIGKAFYDRYSGELEIIKVLRKSSSGLSFDFSRPNNLNNFISLISDKLDGIVFSHGINPIKGFNEIDLNHYRNMMDINLILPTLIIQKLQNQLNDGCSIIFFSSIANRKGSYDPSYAAAKSGMIGLMHSICNALPNCRINILTLGLVKDTRVEQKMTADFKKKHSSRMYGNRLIHVVNVTSLIKELIFNDNINRSEIRVDGGYI